MKPRRFLIIKIQTAQLSKVELHSSNIENSLKINFIKGDNTWHVTNEHAIMYIGDQDSCKTYINYTQPSA